MILKLKIFWFYKLEILNKFKIIKIFSQIKNIIKQSNLAILTKFDLSRFNALIGSLYHINY